MKSRKQKAIVSAVSVFGIVVLVVAGLALKPAILEQWYLWELESEDEQDRKLAAEKLEDEFATSMSMLQVRLGMPKNKQLTRMMEEGPARKMIEKADLEMHNDFRKEELFKLKEELYYIIDEKQHQADLTEKGRQLISPNDPDAFMLPDLPSIFSDLDKDDGKDERAKEEGKALHQERFETVSEQIHTILETDLAFLTWLNHLKIGEKIRIFKISNFV